MHFICSRLCARLFSSPYASSAFALVDEMLGGDLQRLSVGQVESERIADDLINEFEMRRLDEFSLLGWDSVQPVVDRNIADAVAFCSQNPVVDLQLVHSLLLARDRLNQSVGSKAEVRTGTVAGSSTGHVRYNFRL